MTAITARLCPICSDGRSRTITSVSTTFDRPLSSDRFILSECDEYKVVFLSPMPTEDDFDLIYAQSIQFEGEDAYSGERAELAIQFIRRCYRTMLGLIEKDRQVRVLEFGAGLAWMARAAKIETPDTQTTAQDVSPETAAKCPWVDEYIVAPSSGHRLDSRGPYDVISLTNVLEHVPSPVHTLQRCRELLTPSGCVLLTAPHAPKRWREAQDPNAWLE